MCQSTYVHLHLRSSTFAVLANVAHGAARICQDDLQVMVFTALATAAERHVDDFNAQELANTAWAFATASHVDAELFTALARAVQQRLGDFSTQNLANTG